MNKLNIFFILSLVVMVVLGISLVSADLQSNLISYWKLDGTTGPMVDEVSGFDGTNNGATRGYQGILGNSFLFKTGDTGTLGNIANLTAFNYSTFSMSFWVNMSNLANNHAIIERRPDGANDANRPWTMQGHWGLNKFRFLLTNSVGSEGNVVTTGPLVANATTHVIVSRNHTSGRILIYVNGSLETNTTSVLGLLKESSNMTLGNTGVEGLDGTLDEIGYWGDKMFSQTDAASLYNDGAGKEYPFDVPTTMTFSNFNITAINSSKAFIGGREVFNTANLTAIEFANISFTVAYDAGIKGDITINYTADGSNGCSLGNNQSLECFNFDSNSWIQFVNGTNTTTFKDEGARGDSITCNYVGSASLRNYTCQIDEHYNPNVFKWYEADYKFTDVKFQNGVNQRIHQNNILKIKVNETLIPTDADQYKLDFRANFTLSPQVPNSPIIAHACNSTYSTGNPETQADCSIIGSINPSEFQDDGSKVRLIFTNTLVTGLGDIGFITLSSNELSPNRYYFIKSYGVRNPVYTTKWEYSNNDGTSWANLADGYETELNINWFSAGADPTLTLFQFTGLNDTDGFFNSSIYNVTWNIDASQNYAPLISLSVPTQNQTINGINNATWIIVDPNSDSLQVNLTLHNGTSQDISLEIFNNTANVTWDTTLFTDGTYNFTATVYENATTPSLTGTDTHTITIHNNPPNVTGLTETPSDPATYAIPTASYEFNATIVDSLASVDKVFLEFNGTNYTASSNGNVWNVTLFNLPSSGSVAYGYTWWANDTLGNSNNTEGGTYTLKKRTPGLVLAITPSTVETYPSETTATGSNCPAEITCQLFRKNDDAGGFILVSNPEIELFGTEPSPLNYTYNSSETQNFTSQSISKLLAINQGIANVTTFIGGSMANNTGNNNSIFNLTGFIQNIDPQHPPTITLYNNGTLINNGSTAIFNNTQFNLTGSTQEIFNITTIFVGDANLTAGYDTWYVTINPPSLIILGSNVTKISPSFSFRVPHFRLGRYQIFP